ncbi:uncharacterized protein LOC143146862 isoform X2 [Ptiloglossa arizonensis]|uniref:uncharacterized protein LOC143146862 isoform X2 n=1 Tax=Ptiloglossa arizonensis TaxID=3350558 RepID=UPI003F9F8C55
MSKSRSSDEKDREKDKESAEQAVDNDTGKEKADCEKDVEEDTIGENEEGDEKGATNGCNGERNTNVDYDTEDNAKGENVQLPLNQLQLATELESNLKSPVFASNSLMTRLEHAAVAQKHEEEKNNDSEASREQENRTKAPKILHKSSKQFYRAMAKQWGITCKMSDHCRCLDCQSCYFDCEYDKNEHEKTDGGLGAGTPMFISEVMQGSGCVLL